MTAATVICAASFADDTTEVENRQSALNAAVSAEASVEAEQIDSVLLGASAMANAFAMELAGGDHVADSEQEFSGAVSARAETHVHSADGMVITSAEAFGNSLTAGAGGDLSLRAGQTAADGSTVDAMALLRVDSYALMSITAASAAANAVEVDSREGWAALELRQDSGADVSATAMALAPDGGLAWNATVAAAAAGNSATATGAESDIHMMLEQTNRGAITATTVVEAGGGAMSGLYASQATGNLATIDNEWGYAHMQGVQTNTGAVTAVTDVWSGESDDKDIVVSAEAIGNSAMLNNIGADIYMGVGQVNEGPVSATARLETGTGGEAILSATAYGNAQTGYVCAECPVNTNAFVNQTNSGPVSATTTARMNGGSIIGSATAVGNSASFVARRPGQ
ncbi:MAG: holdfast anchor protein HfaD [Maricaulaceae bacterium]|nr:holdfast anchor protein HfaD [Maricaulaceae bacterium]